MIRFLIGRPIFCSEVFFVYIRNRAKSSSRNNDNDINDKYNNDNNDNNITCLEAVIESQGTC